MSKETFKIFAKAHPELAKEVLSEKVSWQKLYELYDIYGEDSSVWNTYFTPKEPLKDIFNTFKNMNMEEVQKGVTSLQKTISFLQEIGLSKDESPLPSPKPLYTYFDD